MIFKRKKATKQEPFVDDNDLTDKQAELKSFFTKIRKNKNKTLKDVAEYMKVSVPYMSQVENGKKTPSDIFIRELAGYYQIEEQELFEKVGKIPLGVYEAVESNKTLQNIISGIQYNKKLPEEEKQKLIDEIYQLYIDRLKDYEASIKNQKGGD